MTDIDFDQHVCDPGPETRTPCSGDSRFEEVRTYCRICGGQTSRETVKA